MIYNWKCKCGETLETTIFYQYPNVPQCKCGLEMYRDYNINIRGASYSKPIHSTSLGINPCQIEEHRRLYPDIKLDSECRPVFENFSQQDAYLKKTGFDKLKW